MKKLFTLIVAICATTLAWADDSGYCGSTLHGSTDWYKVHYYFESSTGTLTFSGTGDMGNNSVSYLSDRPWNAYSSSIKKVVIENGVTNVGKYAFYGCTGLTSITIPNSVKSIGEGAFKGCTGLTSITIGNGVTSVGEEAFYDCDNIKTADINSQVALDAIYFTDKLTSIILGDDITSIANAFDGCTGLTSVTIPNSVTSIAGAFNDCTGLTSVTIGNGVTSIGDYTFWNCTGLTSITIPNSVTSIGEWAFSACGLTSITIPNSVTSIGWGAFQECTGLTSITIPNSVTSIEGVAFWNCTGLTSITIPNSVTSIGSSAFKGCTGLTSMTVEATTPPSYSSTENIVSNYNIPLYVPAGSVDAYKTATVWKKFTNIQAIPATGVNEATAEKSEVKKIIDRNGIIYIEKDGTRYFLNGGKAE